MSVTSAQPGSPDAPSHPVEGARPNAVLVVGVVGATFSVFGWIAIRWAESQATALPWLILVFGLGSTLLLLGHVRSMERATKAIEQVNGRLRLEVEIRRTSEASLQAAKEAAETADQAKSRFMASASQDLRKPLSAILRGLDRILLSESEERRRDEVAQVKRAATSTLDILDELVDLTQTYGDSIRDVSQPFDPRAAIQSVVQPLAPQARKRGLELKAVFDESLPASLCGSVDRLRQVVTRLLNNAFHSTPSGTVTVATGVTALNDQQVLLHVKVSHPGAGISMEDIARACEPGSRSEEDSQAPYTDIRRGLTIAHLLVRRMNGRLDVEHGHDGGSTFSIEVPVQLIVESALAQDSATYSLTPPTKSSQARPADDVKVRL